MLVKLPASVDGRGYGTYQRQCVIQRRARVINEVKLGVVPESTGLYSRLTAWENIRYHSRIYGIDDQVAWNRVSHFAKQLDLTDSLSRHTKGFSRGMRQKLPARALAHGPDILLLDEPTAGLDVTSARTVRKLVGNSEMKEVL